MIPLWGITSFQRDQAEKRLLCFTRKLKIPFFSVFTWGHSKVFQEDKPKNYIKTNAKRCLPAVKNGISISVLQFCVEIGDGVTSLSFPATLLSVEGELSYRPLYSIKWSGKIGNSPFKVSCFHSWREAELTPSFQTAYLPHFLAFLSSF